LDAPRPDEDRPLAARVIAIPENRQLDVLASLLERRGARVVRCPLVGIEDTADEDGVRQWLERFIATPPDLAVFYTGEGIDRLLAFAQRFGLRDGFLAALARATKVTRGPKPKRALRRLGLDADLEAEAPTTEGLVRTLRTLAVDGKRVTVQLYDAGQDPALLEDLAARGARLDTVAPYTYRPAADDDAVAALIGDLDAGEIDAIAFTSKSQVRRLWAVARSRALEPTLMRGLERTRVAAVGPVVAAELGAAGIRVAAMPEPSYTMKPLVTSLCELLAAD
jgi:uroporphyrinogen-III synthase